MRDKLAVVGGGITGLVCALRLQQAGCQVTVYEAADEPGGKISSGSVGGIEVEDGPDAFLPRDEVPLDLLRELGLARTRSPAVFGAYIWHRGALRRLPPGSPYGIPRSPTAAREAGLLSALGTFRAGLETLNRSPLTGPDISIGTFVRSRFGHEVATNLVDPLLAGVRGGTADGISLAAAAKDVDALARQNRSLLVALRANEPTDPTFVSPDGGMTRLIEELAERIDDLRTGSRVSAVIPDGSTVSVTEAGGTDPSTDPFAGVVLTCPPFVAAEVLRGAAPDVATDLDRIEYASLAVITLVFPPGSFEVPPDGSGFLVPTGSELTISACTWYSTKWPHVTSDGRQVVRCVIGRAGNDPIIDREDNALVELVHGDLQEVLSVSAPPLSHRVVRWHRGIPQYGVGHLELVDSIEQRLRERGPVILAGAGYRGSGIPDCIAQANEAAHELTRLVAAGRG